MVTPLALDRSLHRHRGKLAVEGHFQLRSLYTDVIISTVLQDISPFLKVLKRLEEWDNWLIELNKVAHVFRLYCPTDEKPTHIADMRITLHIRALSYFHIKRVKSTPSCLLKHLRS